MDIKYLYIYNIRIHNTHNMIGLGWATLYNTILEKYEKYEKCQKPSTLLYEEKK